MTNIIAKIFLFPLFALLGIVLEFILEIVGYFICNTTYFISAEDALYLGVSSGIIFWVLVGLLIHISTFSDKWWFIVVTTISFVIMTLLEAFIVHYVKWWDMAVGFVIPTIVFIIIIAIIAISKSGSHVRKKVISKSSSNVIKKVILVPLFIVIGVVLTAIPMCIGCLIFNPAYIVWSEHALYLGLSSGIIFWILVVLACFSYFSYEKCWFFVVMIISFAVATILENITTHHAEWWEMGIGFVIPTIVFIIILTIYFSGDSGSSSSDSSYSGSDSSNPGSSNPGSFTPDYPYHTSFDFIHNFPALSAPKKFLSTGLSYSPYVGDDETTTRLEPGYHEGEFYGSNGVNYHVDSCGKLIGSDGTTYVKNDDGDWEIPAPRKFSYIGLSDSPYIGDDGTTRLEPGGHYGVFHGTNGIEYHVDSWGKLVGNDGTTYVKNEDGDWEKDYY